METAPRTKLDDIQDLLEENLEATKENTKLLKAMRRDAMIGGIVKALLWLLAIGLSVYFTVAYLEPLMKPMAEAAGGFRPEDYQALIDLYKGQFGQ